MNKSFKDLVKTIDKQVKDSLSPLPYTYLDYEYVALRIIESLEVSQQLKRQLREKFANKAKELYFEAQNTGFSNIYLMDKYDVFGNEEDSIIEEYVLETLAGIDELFQSLIEEKEEREPSKEELDALSHISDEESQDEEVFEDHQNTNTIVTPVDMECDISEEEIQDYPIEEDIEESLLDDLTDEEIERLVNEMDFDEGDELPF